MIENDKITIVLVDDEEDVRSLYLTILEEVLPGAEIFEAKDGLEALNLIMAVEPDLVVSDIKMPNMDGRRLLKISREFRKSCHFVFISGYGKDYLYEFLRYGAFDVLEKPLNLDEIEECLSRVLYFIKYKRQTETKIAETLLADGVDEKKIAAILQLQEKLLKERYTNLLNEDIRERDEDDEDYFPEGGNVM